MNFDGFLQGWFLWLAKKPFDFGGDPVRDAHTGIFWNEFYHFGVGQFYTNFADSSSYRWIRIRPIFSRVSETFHYQQAVRFWFWSGSRFGSRNYLTEFLLLCRDRDICKYIPRLQWDIPCRQRCLQQYNGSLITRYQWSVTDAFVWLTTLVQSWNKCVKQLSGVV